MSVRLSEKISSERSSRTAKASAMSGDRIEDSTIDPVMGASSLGPENIHPSPLLVYLYSKPHLSYTPDGCCRFAL
ncbi:hypothetical protein Bca4012_090471 [Brassica carinata]|uniref:(rape) hypothetical protein n=1 Tax=Brassica napus TaxID=3708 RepID=A0A816S0Y5_BRANA|nr:unnamed protein product [Brassica napus]